jgi:hypothetical protein
MIAVLLAGHAAWSVYEPTILPFLAAIFLAGLRAGLVGSACAAVLSVSVLMGTPPLVVEMRVRIDFLFSRSRGYLSRLAWARRLRGRTVPRRCPARCCPD